MVAEASSGSTFFNLWLKAEKYSVVQTNTIPTAGSAIQVVASLGFGILADNTGKRALMVNIVSLLTILSNILLSVWNIPKGALFFAFFLSFTGSAAQPIVIVSLFMDRD
jgi:MFS transporter, ACS family, pantothenate transporter